MKNRPMPDRVETLYCGDVAHDKLIYLLPGGKEAGVICDGWRNMNAVEKQATVNRDVWPLLERNHLR